MTDESRPLLDRESEVEEQLQDDDCRPKSCQESGRKQTRQFLASKWGHRSVLLLVALDVACIFAVFLLELYICQHSCERGRTISKVVPTVVNALGIVSLVFSCLFMVELMASLWAFGFKLVSVCCWMSLNTYEDPGISDRGFTVWTLLSSWWAS